MYITFVSCHLLTTCILKKFTISKYWWMIHNLHDKMYDPHLVPWRLFQEWKYLESKITLIKYFYLFLLNINYLSIIYYLLFLFFFLRSIIYFSVYYLRAIPIYLLYIYPTYLKYNTVHYPSFILLSLIHIQNSTKPTIKISTQSFSEVPSTISFLVL